MLPFARREDFSIVAFRTAKGFLHCRNPFANRKMLDFCVDRGIASIVEAIPIQKINEAYDRLLKGDVKYRFVIDMLSLK